MTDQESNMINVQHYIEIPHDSTSYGLGIGIVEGTDDLYLERFMKVFDDTMTLNSITFFGGAKTIDRTHKESLKEKYIRKLRYVYNKNQSIRNTMKPMVHDFGCIAGTRMRILEL